MWVVFQFLADVLRTRFGRAPKHALATVVNLNSACNLRCSYCYIATNTLNFPTGYAETGLPFDALKNVLQAARNVSHAIAFLGGEPFLRNDLQAILQYCKNDLRFVNISVVTNGLFLKKKADCIPYIDHLVVSYDMARYKQYQKELDQLRADILELKAAGILRDLVFDCTFMPDEPLEPWYGFLTFVNDNAFRIFAQPCRDDDGDIQSWDAFNQLTQRIGEKFGDGIFFNNSLYLGRYNHDVKYTACIPRARLYVDVEGNLVYPCEKFAFRKIGNLVHHHDVDRMWAEAEQTYGSFPSDQCGKCGFNCYFESTVVLREPMHLLKTYLRSTILHRRRARSIG